MLRKRRLEFSVLSIDTIQCHVGRNKCCNPVIIYEIFTSMSIVIGRITHLKFACIIKAYILLGLDIYAFENNIYYCCRDTRVFVNIIGK